MRLSDLLLVLSRHLLIPAIILTLLLYCYAPLLECSFPLAKPAEAGCSIPGQQKDAIPAEIAPFRLLAFGDPQLEGDTSLPGADGPTFPSLLELWWNVESEEGWSSLPFDLAQAVKDLFMQDVANLLRGIRKRVDLWGNDLYLAHIYRSVSWWSQPTHTVVLGDLLGSQWIGDDEFERRSKRFWKTVFKGGEKVPPSITDSSGRVEILGQGDEWERRIIAVAGNHDIGYAGDIDERRIERFEEAYGRVNWEITFRLQNDSATSPAPFGYDSQLLPSQPELRLIILNSMNLDAPAYDEDLQQQSRQFAGEQLHRANQRGDSATVLLTHIPFHKEAGICHDSSFFDFFSEEKGGGIKEQNHLTEESSNYILSSLAGPSKPGKAIVLNGHDHEGCDTYYFLTSENDSQGESPQEGVEPQWQAKRHDEAATEIESGRSRFIREVTARSMMGQYSGNSVFLSGWFDRDAQEWKFEYNTCRLGVQHIWWIVHGLDLVVLGLALAGVVLMVVEEVREADESTVGKDAKVKTT